MSAVLTVLILFDQSLPVTGSDVSHGEYGRNLKPEALDHIANEAG